MEHTGGLLFIGDRLMVEAEKPLSVLRDAAKSFGLTSFHDGKVVPFYRVPEDCRHLICEHIPIISEKEAFAKAWRKDSIGSQKPEAAE